MSPRNGVILPGEDLAAAVRALASCSHLLAWRVAHAAPRYHPAVRDLTRDAGRERTAGELYYDVAAAVDRLGAALPGGGLR